MPTPIYTVGQRITYKVYWSTPFGSIGSSKLPGVVTAVSGANVTYDLDGDIPPQTTYASDPNLQPA